MDNIDRKTLALKIAEALLLSKGELSLDDIKALPFIDDPQFAEIIAKYLTVKFKTRIDTIKNVQKGVGEREELIRLMC